MKPLEQQVREALTDGVLSAVADLIDTEFYASAQERILTALRPLLEQQAKWRDALIADLNRATDKLCTIRHAVRGKLDLSDVVTLVEQQAAAVATLTAERDEARQMASLWHRDCHPRNRNGLTFSLHEHDAKKIAAWSGETR